MVTNQFATTTSYPMRKFCQLYAFDEAWNNGKPMKASWKSPSCHILNEYSFIYTALFCNCSCWHGSSLVPIGNKDCLEVKSTNRWWDAHFISVFSSVVTHESHVDSHLWPVAKTHLIHCQFSTLVLDELGCKDLYSGIERKVSVYIMLPFLLFFILRLTFQIIMCESVWWFEMLLDRVKKYVVDILEKCNYQGEMRLHPFQLERYQHMA